MPTRITSLLILLSTLLISFQSYSQPTKFKKKYLTTETQFYHVLKKDRRVKHGQFVSISSGIVGSRILDFGQYDKGLKSGYWYHFDSFSPSNPVTEEGTYANDQKNGTWKRYYSFDEDTLSTGSKSGLIEPKTEGGKYRLQLDTSGQMLMEEGVYIKGQKRGVWKYYNKSGNLIHEFDHTQDAFLNIADSVDFSTFYVGGFPRFKDYFHRQLGYRNIQTIINEDAKIQLRVNENGTYTPIKRTGDDTFYETVLAVLKEVPQEWITIPKKNPKPLLMEISAYYIVTDYLVSSYAELEFRIGD